MTKAANGRSSIYKGQDGSWHGWVSFSDTLDGRRRRKHVQATTKCEVAEKVGRLEQQRQSGYVGDRPVTVAEWLDTWIEGKVTAAARARTVEGYLLDRRHIVAVIGSVRVGRLTAEHIDGLWRAILASGAGPATCAHVRRTLSAALGAAVDRGHLARNPVRLSHPPRYEPREVEPLSACDARMVLAAAAGRRNAARWSVALALGLRQGEALGLRWSDVDLDAGTVTVRVQLQNRPWRHGCAEGGEEPTCGHGPGRCDSRVDGGPVFVPVKSASGRRILGMPPPMVEQMRAHREIQDDERSRAGGAGLAQDSSSPERTAARSVRRRIQRSGTGSSGRPPCGLPAYTTPGTRLQRSCSSKACRPVLPCGSSAMLTCA